MSEKGCGNVVAGNDEFGVLCCGDERGHFDIETGEWIQVGYWLCEKCEENLKDEK